MLLAYVVGVLRCMALPYVHVVKSFDVILTCVTLHVLGLRCVKLRYITLRCVVLPYVHSVFALRHVTLSCVWVSPVMRSSLRTKDWRGFPCKCADNQGTPLTAVVVGGAEGTPGQ